MPDEKTKNLFSKLNDILQATNIDDVTAETAGYTELPDGYYNCEVTKAELRESKTGKPMAMLVFRTTENGIDIDEDGNHFDIPKTTGKTFNICYVLEDENKVRRFVADMLKFEGETSGEPILGKEYFTTAEVLEDALEILVGLRIYMHASTSENDDGSKSSWKNLISWARAEKLELPID